MLTPQQLSELKRTTPAFNSTPLALEERLIREAEFVSVPAGTRLFTDGDPCEGMLFVTTGRIRAVKISEDGREILLYHVHAGELCVLTVGCLLGDTPYPADGICDTDVTGVRMPSQFFHELVREHPEFRVSVFDLMGARLNDVMNLVAAVAFHRLDRRVAALLIERAANRKRPIEVTHYELAKDLGSSREIISRVLESFEADGLVELGRKRIAIRDRDRLNQISSAGEI